MYIPRCLSTYTLFVGECFLSYYFPDFSRRQGAHGLEGGGAHGRLLGGHRSLTAGGGAIYIYIYIYIMYII